MYADFTDYKEIYYGQQIADADVFRTAAARASEYMDSVTFGRLESGVPEAFAEPVKKCCCALAEAFYTYQMYGAGGSGSMTDSSRLKKSETNSKYSVTYGTPSEELAALFGSENSFFDYIRSICMRYLGRTGLLYRGV